MKTFLGLDVGTENIGYALAKQENEQLNIDVELDSTSASTKGYEVIKINGRQAMGVLSFESAQTAVNRRTYRATRRRLARRRYRIALLQEIFNDAIMAKDKNFLRRLGENDLHIEDRNIEGKYSLFNDSGFNDIIYYKKYPTIYHLREKLMAEGTDDVRLLYLAIHHIIKYRGHFLLSGEMSANEIGGVNQLKELIENLNDKLKENKEDDDSLKFDEFSTNKLEDVKDLICGTGKITKSILDNITTGKKFVSKKDKKTKLIELFGISNNSTSKKIIDAIMGYKVNISDLFGSDCYPKEEVKGFYMSDEWENIIDLQLLKDNMLHSDIIAIVKSIYDWVTLNELLKGKASISSAMVELYNTHKKDLKELKSFIKTYCSDKFEEVFGIAEDKICNYVQYIGGGRYDGEKLGANGRTGKTCTQEEFYKYIKKIIESVEQENAKGIKENLLDKIENKVFMPKIVSKNNSTLPYQLNMMELDCILNKAKENPNFAFLNEVSEGTSNIEKFKLLLSFRIPYYVGPVKEYKNDLNKKYAWAVRKDSGRITPWNIENKIDYGKSNEEFIKRMTNKCTYLKIADTLPKNSILFSKFMCLNEINTLKIDGNAITSELKKEIFDNVYNKKNPSVKKIKNYLTECKGYEKGIVLSGIDNELKANMNTYLLYKDKLGDKVDKDRKMVERIIFLSTIHNDSKMLENSIKEEFGGKLTDKEINDIKGFTFNGWGSLSAEFLAGYKNNGIKLLFNGEMLDIIDIMYEYNYNLQQIIYHESCNYSAALKDYNTINNITENTYINYEDDIEEYPCSPSVKKCVWQTFKLVKDIVKQTKVIPDVVFIESCRENTDNKKGKRTQKRRDYIESVYEEAKKIAKKEGYNDFIESIDECKNRLKDYTDNELKKENLYLYFMQLGKDMYTNKPIDLNQVLNGTMYDHDHIIPQAIIKDDSFTNLVLVARKENAEKSKNYPLETQFKQPTLWKKLNKIGLISNEKLARLMRNNDITEEEQEKFINRQLVETSQTVIILKDLLTRYFAGITDKKVEIVLSKAGNVSMFRKEFDLTKSREVNDFHHAWDAYLNIVVGDILNKEFNHNWYIRHDNGRDKSYNFLNVLRRQATANNYEILNTIKKVMDSTDFQMVKLPAENKGSFYSEVLKTAEKDEKSKLIPMCDSKIIDGKEINPKCNTSKYGGYKTANTAYFIVVDSDDKKRQIMRNIVAISIFDDARIKNKKLTYQDVFAKLGLKNGRLAKIEGLKEPIIKTGSLLDFGAYKLRLSGNSDKQLKFHNANQLFVSSEQNSYIKALSTLVDKVLKVVKKDAKEDDKDRLATEIIDESKRRKNLPLNKNANIVIINEDENLKMYEFFINKLSHYPYKKIPGYSSLIDILNGAKDNFSEKTIYTQIVLLLNIIKAFQCNALDVNVKELKYINKKGLEKHGGEHQCVIVRNWDITEDKNLYLVNQSMSGLKEKRIKLSLY